MDIIEVFSVLLLRRFLMNSQKCVLKIKYTQQNNRHPHVQNHAFRGDLLLRVAPLLKNLPEDTSSSVPYYHVIH